MVARALKSRASVFALTAHAIQRKRARIATIHASQDPHAKFEARTATDEKRRKDRKRMRQTRASTRKAGTTNKRTKKIVLKSQSSSKRVPVHIPAYCCGKRMQRCCCFQFGRGLEIVRTEKKDILKIIPAVLESRIQTWRDTAYMPAYMKQIGWTSSMQYAWLFPIAFTWRHFSNEDFWCALHNSKGALQNHPPDFKAMECIMRQFQSAGVPYHGGLFL